MMNDYFKDKVVIEGDCWLWQRATNKQGHGICSDPRQRRSITAHRLSYELHVEDVSKGLVVRHMCENKGCCNPNHLKVGTQADNYWDMSDKQRKGLSQKGVATKNVRDSHYRMSTEEAQKIASKRKTVGNRFGTFPRKNSV